MAKSATPQLSEGTRTILSQSEKRDTPTFEELYKAATVIR